LTTIAGISDKETLGRLWAARGKARVEMRNYTLHPLSPLFSLPLSLPLSLCISPSFLSLPSSISVVCTMSSPIRVVLLNCRLERQEKRKEVEYHPPQASPTRKRSGGCGLRAARPGWKCGTTWKRRRICGALSTLVVPTLRPRCVPETQTLNPQPEAPNPQPSILNPQPPTLSSPPSTLNPKPEARNPTPKARNH